MQILEIPLSIRDYILDRQINRLKKNNNKKNLNKIKIRTNQQTLPKFLFFKTKSVANVKFTFNVELVVVVSVIHLSMLLHMYLSQYYTWQKIIDTGQIDKSSRRGLAKTEVDCYVRYHTRKDAELLLYIEIENDKRLKETQVGKKRI